MDVGKYNKNSALYKKIITKMYKEHQPITLSSEYGHFIQDNTMRLLFRLARYKFVARLIQKKDTVLEVGSGSGIGSIFLGQNAKKVIGLEIRDFEIEDARKVNKRKNVTFDKTDFFTYRPKEKFDVIVALDVIEHMTPAVGRKLLDHMTRHLKKTGMVIVGTPSIYSYPYQSPQSKASHIKCYDQNELQKVMSRYFERTLAFSMNDEMVHTGFAKMSWYYFLIGFYPAGKKRS